MATRPIIRPVAASTNNQRVPIRPLARPAPEPTRLNPEPPKPEPIFDTKPAAAILGKPAETLKKWRLRGKGPDFVRYDDGSIRYRLSALMKYIDACTVRPSRS